MHHTFVATQIHHPQIIIIFFKKIVTELPFFACKVRLGHTGVQDVLSLGPLNEFESLGLLTCKAGLEEAKKELAESIQKGVSFIKK
ncbi:hypothetical protein ACJRO7_031221 [Eucalyptus globulus]|uniref:Lactate/malate dehydrogenase C-terminal domain-containing protein n=1 Tax=Eucalyptus globulus TaxID=34317 RepID=A0ABD3JI16_EUCGL